jgi:RNA polymerase sigma factor (sigma-70 family)
MSVDPISALPSRPSPGAAGALLGELYSQHSRMVYGICRMLLRDPNEAEDATQQVFLSAYRNLLTGTEVRDPAAWLGTIARNACRRRATARMREPLGIVDDEPTLVGPSVEETALGREAAAALYAELAVLPEKQREAVVLRDLYGLRYDEVATALGTSRPAVEALLFRARRRLQRRLRPGFAAGVLVVPLAVQESIAYAVPGFASTAATPAAAVAAAAGIPLVAKLAAASAAVGIAGSAGVVAERSLHDPPARPPGNGVGQVVPVAANKAPQQSELLPVPTGGFSVVRQQAGDGDDGDEGEADPARAAGAADDDEREEADDEDRDESRGPGEQDDSADDRSGKESGPGAGEDGDESEPEVDEPDGDGDKEQVDLELDGSGSGGDGEEDADDADDAEKIELDE